MDSSNWQNLIESHRSRSIEFRRREASLLMMVTLGIVFLSVMIIANYRNYPPLLNDILFFIDLIFVGISIFYLRTRNLRYAATSTAVVAFVLTALLIYTGGKENTALYWVMFFPLMAYSILGVRWGTFYSILSLIQAGVLLYTPELIIAEYSSIAKSRFLLGYVCIILFSFINEYFRSREYSETQNVSLTYQKDANTDPLTQIPNRRFLDSTYIKNSVENASSFCVVLADLDKFKAINDTYGHDVGDDALVHAVKRFSSRLRQSDLLCRYGGEEFLVCLPETNIKQAEKIANALRVHLESSPLELVSEELTITCSFGVASLHNRTFEEAIQEADKNLYKAKAKGRNTVVAH